MSDVAAPSFDPYAVERDPYPRWKRLRDEVPLYRNDDLDLFVLSRHADVRAILRDWQTYSSASGVTLDFMNDQAAVERFRNMLIEDPEPHTLHRHMLAAVFTPRRVAGLEPAIRELCRAYLAEWQGDRFEFVERFANRLPMAVMGALLGIPPADYDFIIALVNAFSNRFDPSSGGYSPRDQLARYLEAQIADVRKRPQDGLLSDLAHLRIEDHGRERELTAEETINQATVLTVAGSETTSKLLAIALEVLARHPEQRELLREDPALCGNAVEEIMRYEGPAWFFGRTTTRQVTWYGRELPVGARLIAHVGAANRDDRQFNEPDRLDVRRKLGNNQLGFGAGIHYCLGAPLARLEVRIMLEELLAHHPRWEVDYAASQFLMTPAMRGWRKLTLVSAI